MDQDIFGNIRDSPNVVLDTIVRPPALLVLVALRANIFRRVLYDPSLYLVRSDL